MSEWRNFISEYAISDLLSDVNDLVGEERQLARRDLESVAASAYSHYNTYLDKAELPNAILWDLNEYANYASGITMEPSEDALRYSSFLPSGHPDSVNIDPTVAAAWIASDPDLSPAASAAIVASLTPSDDYVKVVHATTRLKALTAAGEIPDSTKALIHGRIAKITGIPADLL